MNKTTSFLNGNFYLLMKDFNKQIPVKSSKESFFFIDFIRFMSIVGITSVHSLFFGLPQNVVIENFLKQTDHPLILIIFVQLFRFSVISFCMISGFLLGKKIIVENHLKIFYQRVKVTLPPYIIAFTLTAIYWHIWELLKNGNSSFYSIFLNQLFGSSFWYVPSNLLSFLAILLSKNCS